MAPGRRLWMVAAAAAIGLANAIALLGRPGLDPTSVSWLAGDAAQNQVGWAFFRHEPSWHWPLTWSQRLGAPAGISISQLGPAPLVALLLRPLSPILPEPFQYLGLWAALSFVLQAYFALRLCLLLCNGSWTVAFLGTLLLVGSPAMTARLAPRFGHFALAGHWLILASLYLYFRDAEPTRRWLLPACGLVLIATGIDPYLAAMCLLVAFAAVTRRVLEGRCAWYQAGTAIAVVSAVTGVGLTVFGLVTSAHLHDYATADYGLYSMNLLAPLDPGEWRSVALPPLAQATAGQYEGYNYLGLGVIGLWLVALLARPRAVLRLCTKRTVPLLAVAVVCTVAAASSTVTLGPATIARIPFPHALDVLTHTLRTSGRLFWPTYYLLVLGAVVLTSRSWRSPWREALLVGTVLVQAADLADLRRDVRAGFDRVVESPLRSPRWAQLGQSHDRLVVLPAWQCDPWSTPGGIDGYATFGLLAAAEGLTINSYYPARLSPDQFRVHCQELPGALLGGHLDASSAYVVSDKLAVAWALDGVSSHRCDVVDGFNLCTRNDGAAETGDACPPIVRVIRSIFAPMATPAPTCGSAGPPPGHPGRGPTVRRPACCCGSIRPPRATSI
jgi:hypothetical protein